MPLSSPETGDETISPARALRTALIATASNPLTIVWWAGVFSAASTARLVHTTATAAALCPPSAAGRSHGSPLCPPSLRSWAAG